VDVGKRFHRASTGPGTVFGRSGRGCGKMRLARSAAPVSESHLKAGFLHSDKLTVHILAAVAQHEREMISERTRSALQAAKARGKQLGNPKVREAGILGNVVIQEAARKFAANVLPVIREIQTAGTKSNAAIAAKLNERRVPTARGGVWTHVQVRAVIGRGVPA
jgi:hypothetical protein